MSRKWTGAVSVESASRTRASRAMALMTACAVLYGGMSRANRHPHKAQSDLAAAMRRKMKRGSRNDRR